MSFERPQVVLVKISFSDTIFVSSNELVKFALHEAHISRFLVNDTLQLVSALISAGAVYYTSDRQHYMCLEEGGSVCMYMCAHAVGYDN